MSKKLSMLALALATASGLAQAHGDAKHEPVAATIKEQKPWGIAGDATAVRRGVTIAMSDNMRFTPDHIQVKRGETVRFVLRNDGAIPHEMVIGTKTALEKHAALMQKFPDMEHDEPYMIHVAPGKTGEIVWHFNRLGKFDFACLIPGHYQSGMKGRIVVNP